MFSTLRSSSKRKNRNKYVRNLVDNSKRLITMRQGNFDTLNQLSL